jgi:uncharacterized BrkB/YihY/UPF0761 family membrane protein
MPMLSMSTFKTHDHASCIILSVSVWETLFSLAVRFAISCSAISTPPTSRKRRRSVLPGAVIGTFLTWKMPVGTIYLGRRCERSA